MQTSTTFFYPLHTIFGIRVLVSSHYSVGRNFGKNWTIPRIERPPPLNGIKFRQFLVPAFQNHVHLPSISFSNSSEALVFAGNVQLELVILYLLTLQILYWLAPQYYKFATQRKNQLKASKIQVAFNYVEYNKIRNISPILPQCTERWFRISSVCDPIAFFTVHKG